jgi:hypothetical protein
LLSHITAHSGEDLAGVSAGGFDEESNAGDHGAVISNQ